MAPIVMHSVIGERVYAQIEPLAQTQALGTFLLGCMLVEMALGQRAAAGNSVESLRRAHCTGDLRPLPGDLPEPVRAVVVGCLALAPGERYASWGSVGAELEAALEAVSGRAVPAAPTAAALSREERVAAGWSYSEMGAGYLDIGKAEVALGYFEASCAVLSPAFSAAVLRESSDRTTKTPRHKEYGNTGVSPMTAQDFPSR